MAAPTRVGRYEIVRLLGKGMTEVYLAIDTVENRKTALKLIPSGNDPKKKQHLEAERRGAAIQKELQLVDPRMVEVYEVGDVDGYFYIAMQYVEGRTVSEVLRADSVVDPTRAAIIALEICEQLAKFHAWQSTVVHGDIKPSNVHLGPNDTVRLLDFGIAKTLRADRDATAHEFGSPSYCAPERLSRSAVDQQSDLWAVGATLYEMLAGAPPYQAENTRKLEELIRSKRPPRALPVRCPKALRLIVKKALAPEARERYGSAVEFQADLQAFLENKLTLAEMEHRAVPSATIEAAREYLRKATRTIARAKRAMQMAGAAGWFAAGMALWIGGALIFQNVWARKREPVAAAPIVAKAPISRDEEIRALYVRDAEGVFAAFRSSADPSLHHFDWQKAEVCLERAVQLGASDDATWGRLLLSKGYATLQRLEGGRYSEEAAAQLRLYARDQFRAAERKMPENAEPHLALARVYVYSLPNVDEAMAEFTAAERLGASLGRREIEQQGDVYRFKALSEWGTASRAAFADADHARRLYARVRGFDQVDAHLRELAKVRPVVKVSKTASKKVAKPRWRRSRDRGLLEKLWR